MNDTLRIWLFAKEFRTVAIGSQREYYLPLYIYHEKILEVDRWGYAVYEPSLDIDFEDISNMAGDSIREFERLLKKAIDEGEFQVHDFKDILFFGDNRKIKFHIKGINIGNGTGKFGSKEDRLYFIIKLGKKI